MLALRWPQEALGSCSRIARVVATGECVCLFILPIHSGHQVRWTYQPGSHRRKVTQDFSSTYSFCGACLNFCREKDSAIPFPRRL